MMAPSPCLENDWNLKLLSRWLRLKEKVRCMDIMLVESGFLYCRQAGSFLKVGFPT
jgi:hypothetical protein